MSDSQSYASKSFQGYSLSSFAEALAAKQSVPGGGGAAALVGAVGAALGAMCGNFTLGNERYKDVASDVDLLVNEANRERENLLELIDEDAQAFAPLAQAYALAKDDPSRAEAIQTATKLAAEPPLACMRELTRVVATLEKLAQKGSKLLLSDIACAAYLAASALEAASVNVFVNTSSLEDRVWADQTEDECNKILDEYVVRARSLAARLVAGIRGEED